MGTIYLSPAFAAGDIYSSAKRIFELTTSAAITTGTSQAIFQRQIGSGSTLYPIGRITIHSGVMPTSISTVTSFASYTSTVLCTFRNDNGGVTFAPSDISFYGTPSVITSAYVTATMSGTATWFLLSSAAASSNTFDNGLLWHQIVGSVGPIGGSDDLVISNVNITAGQLVRIFNLRFSIPTTFTF